MRNIDFYLDEARKNTGATSDATLSQMMGISRGAAVQWRTRRSWPQDETMTKLAHLAGIDEQIALLELSLWRTDGEAKKTYEKILTRISTISPATLFFIGAMSPDTAQAAENLYQTTVSTPLPFALGALAICVTICKHNIYYGKFCG